MYDDDNNNNNNKNNRFMTLCLGLSRWVSSFLTAHEHIIGYSVPYPGEPVPEETFTHSHLSRSSTILYQLPSSTTIHSSLPVHFTCLTATSLQVLLVWNLPVHTPHISSPNHCLLFVTHAHTITTCYAVIPRLCHLFLVSLSTLYLKLYHLTKHHTSIWLLSSLPAEVPPHFLSLQARFHFHATCYFAHNCCTVSLS